MGELRLARDLYIAQVAPPVNLITSVRAVLFRNNKVMIARDPDGSFHVMPGGRREQNESEQEALVRELQEETGWSIGCAHRLGFFHFRHQSPKPPEYPYPYPDFLQSLFVAEAADFERRRIRRDGWETATRMTHISRTLEQARPDQQKLLRLALAARAGR